MAPRSPEGRPTRTQREALDSKPPSTIHDHALTQDVFHDRAALPRTGGLRRLERQALWQRAIALPVKQPAGRGDPVFASPGHAWSGMPVCRIRRNWTLAGAGRNLPD